MKPKREDAMVGLFVVVVAAILVTTLFALRGLLTPHGVDYRTTFRFAGGLAAGAPVRFGGVRVGRVDYVGVDPRHRNRILVRFNVAPHTPVNSACMAKITSLSALGDNYLEITTGNEDQPTLPANSMIPSAPYTSLTDITDSLNELTPKVNAVLDNLNGRLAQLQQTIDRVDLLLSDRNQANLAGTLSELHGMLQEDRPQVRSTLDNINADSARLGPLLDHFQKTSILANQTLAQVNGMLSDNRTGLRQSIADLQKTLASTRALVDHLDRSVVYNQDSLDETMENIRLATENLERFTERIKTHPNSLIRSSNIREHRPGETPKP